MGLSVALGVIAGKCGSLRLVLVGPVGCLRGRWRSGPRKWRHAAVSRARVSKHRAPVGALRPQPAQGLSLHILVSKHRAPVGALRQQSSLTQAPDGVSKHRAPVGALRPQRLRDGVKLSVVSKHRAPVGALRRPRGGAHDQSLPVSKHRAPVGALRRLGDNVLIVTEDRQQAPRTCRCIKTCEHHRPTQ